MPDENMMLPILHPIGMGDLCSMSEISTDCRFAMSLVFSNLVE
jgi:hypothetical protein